MRIRNRLTYKFAILVASILFFFSFAIYYFSAYYREQAFDKRLIDKGLTTARLLLNVDEVDIKLLRIIDKNNLSAFQNEKITIYDSNFKKLYSSDDDPEIIISHQLFKELNEKSQIFFNHGKNEVVGLVVNERNQKVFVIVSAYDQFGLSKMTNLQFILIGSFLICMVGVFAAGWEFSGQALKPISDIVNNVKKISAKNLHSRVSVGNGQDEIAQLAIQFNQMLERLEQSFEMQRNFVSNASHELRTPLSTISTQLEITLNSERNREEYKKTIESVQDDIKSLIRLSNGLLDLAQTEMSNAALKKIRLDEVLYQCISEISKKYTSQVVTLKIEEGILDDEQMFIISGNEPLLKTAFLNILDNACKYSNNSPVFVTIDFNVNEIIISIIDTGVGISQPEMEHIFDPFFRGSNARNVSGHGIGLPLTNRIIQIHQGTLDVQSKVNAGTMVKVHLPTLS